MKKYLLLPVHCPKCHSLLVDGEMREFETLLDHVIDPNKMSYPLRPTLVCINEACPASKSDVFWDEVGDYYGSSKEIGLTYNDCTSFYPSHARKQDIEIYKKGLKSKIYLSPAWTLWILMPFIEFSYKSDEWGRVLKKFWKLKWLKRSESRGGFCEVYTFPIPKILSSIRYLSSMLKDKNPSDFCKRSIKDEFGPLASWDRRWWRRAYKFIIKLLYRKEYLLYR